MHAGLEHEHNGTSIAQVGSYKCPSVNAVIISLFFNYCQFYQTLPQARVIPRRFMATYQTKTSMRGDSKNIPKIILLN